MRSTLLVAGMFATLTFASGFQYATMQARQAASATTSFIASSTTATPDVWQCATQNMTRLFDMPKPTGDLLSNLISFGSSLLAPCLKSATGNQAASCSVSDQLAWCPYSTLAPASLTSSYSSYRTAAAYWMARNQIPASSAKRDCPNTYSSAGADGGANWFNYTYIQYRCHGGNRLGSGDPK